ncbi:hypothetical protein [Bradyrhizobium sp. sBnM-33]|uniref:hypothetical protein n=1 Tax=Bradyrhizobium sp. sBnM-33 TaxID=2831780 RepID=UPI00289C800F|nr:hypothetical protein [Bradyrhizobium sp. sBnM-33]
MARIRWWAWSGGSFGAIFIGLSSVVANQLRARGADHSSADGANDRMHHYRSLRLTGPGAKVD